MPPTLAYDLDGNLTNDGRWTYTWDGENRLVAMECPPNTTPAVDGKRLTFTYDALSRRTGKKVEKKLPGTSTWVWLSAEGYLYDGWNLILTVELSPAATPVRRTASYLWGPDLASRSTARSSWQQAGGVGGLVMVLGNATGLTAPNPAMDDYAPLMDRMGNVTAYRKLIGAATVTQKALTANVATLTTSANHCFTPGQSVVVTLSPSDAVFNGTWTISAATATTFSFARTNANILVTSTGGTGSQGSSLAAIYEYDAFGRELRASGPAADFLPFRFSTKFTDRETALVYYGYRYYHSGWGRWINRDPIGEAGGRNLFSMVGNNSINELDYIGLLGWEQLGQACCDICKALKDGIQAKEAESAALREKLQVLLDAMAKDSYDPAAVLEAERKLDAARRNWGKVQSDECFSGLLWVLAGHGADKGTGVTPRTSGPWISSKSPGGGTPPKLGPAAAASVAGAVVGTLQVAKSAFNGAEANARDQHAAAAAEAEAAKAGKGGYEAKKALALAAQDEWANADIDLAKLKKKYEEMCKKQ